jgi:hypothetical protein
VSATVVPETGIGVDAIRRGLPDTTIGRRHDVTTAEIRLAD